VVALHHVYHYARLIETLYELERIEELLDDEDIMGSDLRVHSRELYPEGIGVIEAPRGTLIHHYEVDDRGAITRVNLIVATGHNNFAMNKGVELVARDYIKDGKVTEGIMNRMEHVIRCYIRAFPAPPCGGEKPCDSGVEPRGSALGPGTI
jgi:NAD-reducing hydrogenase large subunit